MKKGLNQMFSATLKQRVDGQVQVTSIRVPKDFLKEHPYIKEEMKNSMERILEQNHIKVLKDVGVIQY